MIGRGRRRPVAQQPMGGAGRERGRGWGPEDPVRVPQLPPLPPFVLENRARVRAELQPSPGVGVLGCGHRRRETLLLCPGARRVLGTPGRRRAETLPAAPLACASLPRRADSASPGLWARTPLFLPNSVPLHPWVLAPGSSPLPTFFLFQRWSLRAAALPCLLDSLGPLAQLVSSSLARFFCPHILSQLTALGSLLAPPQSPQSPFLLLPLSPPHS